MSRPSPGPETAGTVGDPIRVLHLRQSEGRGGGADTVLRQLTVAQVQRSGVAPRIAYLHKPTHCIADLVDPLDDAGVPVDPVPGKALLDLRQVRALLALARRHRSQILHAHDPKSDLLARLVRVRLPRLRLVSTLHGWTARGPKGRLYSALDRLALRGFDARAAVSQALRRQALDGGVSDVVVIPNGVDTAFWHPRPMPDAARSKAGSNAPGRPFTVTFAGRLSAEKCPEIMVRVIRRVADALGTDGVRVHVAGDGPERPAVEGLAARLGLSGSLRFHGTVDVATLAGLYAESDAVLLTSRTEGMPMSLLEAGAIGRPVVATRVGGVAELVEPGLTGLLAESGATDALADHLLTLARDPSRAAAMGAAAAQRVGASFSLDRVLMDWDALYRSVLAAPQGPATA
jgi:glycosyltransferase involved in cell wall biosynthesis